MNNILDLSKKTIIVTGASSGIGRQTAITISELGAKVICIARREEKLIETISMLNGEHHDFYPIDLAKSEKIEAIVELIHSEHGVLNGLIHCAGDTVARPLRLNTYEKVKDSFEAVYFGFIELTR